MFLGKSRAGIFSNRYESILEFRFDIMLFRTFPISDIDLTKAAFLTSKNPHVSICAFCGNPIKPHRIDELNRFYSNEAARLRALKKISFFIILASLVNILSNSSKASM